jgi:integrase
MAAPHSVDPAQMLEQYLASASPDLLREMIVSFAAGFGWMTPHTWRRTYATILHDEFGLSDRQKADLMGGTTAHRRERAR